MREGKQGFSSCSAVTGQAASGEEKNSVAALSHSQQLLVHDHYRILHMLCASKGREVACECECECKCVWRKMTRCLASCQIARGEERGRAKARQGRGMGWPLASLSQIMVVQCSTPHESTATPTSQSQARFASFMRSVPTCLHMFCLLH